MDYRRTAPGFLFSLLVLAAAILARVADPPVINALRGAGFDTLQRLWPRQIETDQPVRIVDIDDASLKELGQWPWPRKRLAALVNGLDELGASAIVFDIVFPEPDRVSPRQLIGDPEFSKIATAAGASADTANWPDSDAEFAASFKNRPVVLAFATDYTGRSKADVPVKTGFAETGESAFDSPLRLVGSTHNLKVLEDAASGLGGISLDSSENQGVARQIPMLWSDGQKYYPSLTLEALRVAQGAGSVVVQTSTGSANEIKSILVGDFAFPVTEKGLFTLHYRPDDPDLYVSAADIIKNRNEVELRARIDGNIVFIGTSATSLVDNRISALGRTIPGVSIHAQAVEQILSQHFLKRPEWMVEAELASVALLGLLVSWLCAVSRPIAPLAVTGVITLGTFTAAVFAFRQLGQLVDATFPLAALIMTFLAGIAWKLLVTDQEGRKMRRAFGHYVAPSVLAEIERNPQLLTVGGEVRDVTVMFVDIVNFTPMSEALTAEELVKTVNGLWDVCGQAILATQGTIDKFIGDAVMAFWNAPVSVTAHQYQAAKAALAVRAALESFNQTEVIKSLLQQRGLPPLSLRIGMASGPAAVGNMGSVDRFDYSVLGDTVNVASRAEVLCKTLGHDIAIAGALSEETRALALLPAGTASLKGKSQQAAIHIVVGDETLAQSKSFATIKAEHAYLAGRISTNPSKRDVSTLNQLAAELANRHPALADYFKALPQRSGDFAQSSKV